MWLMVLWLLGGAHAQDDNEDPRPEETRVGVGAVVGTGFASGPTLRVRTAGGVSMDLTVGTSITSTSETVFFGALELDTKPQSRTLGSQFSLRLPVARIERTDLLISAVGSGRLRRAKAQQLDITATPPGTIDQISNSRTGRLGAAFELDHWVSERATVTAGIGVDVLTATRTNTAVGSDEPTVSMTTTVGATTRAQAGLIVFF